MKELKWSDEVPKPSLIGNEIRLDRKQYLEALRLKLELEPWEFEKALGGLIKNKVIRFNSDETVISPSAA